MASFKPSKASLSSETTPLCRKCVLTNGLSTPITIAEYLPLQVYPCTNAQMALLPNISTYSCPACKAQSSFLAELRLMCIFKEEVNTTHSTGSETTIEHSGGGMQQSDAVESVVKTEVTTEDSVEDYHHDDLLEVVVVSLETLLKREPMDDQQQPQLSHVDLIQEEGSLVGKTTTGPEDQTPISDHNNLGIKHAAEGTTLNQMDTYGEEQSRHTGNQLVSVVGDQRLLRSNKRLSSRKDITTAEFSVSTAQNHIGIHDKDQKQCPHCPSKFARQSRLNDHIRTHTGEKPFVCVVCSKVFHAARNLAIHMKIHNKDQHQCPHCRGKFAQKSKLNDHIRKHTGEMPFVCKVCGKAFHAARNLRSHMKIHDKDQKQCPHCSRKFAQQSRLNDHIRTHTGEKPFMCKVCDKAFHGASILCRHMKIHNKDQHQCPHCPGKFAEQSRLNDHIRTHTGEKPFKCKVCDKAFHRASILCRHMKIHIKDQH